MAGTITVKLYELLRSIGVDVSQKSGSNVKTLATKNKSTATKPGLLAGERDTGGNFGTVLDIFKKEAQYINGMNDVEQMAFLNNIMDYKEFGGSSIKNTEGIRALDEAKNLTNESSDLKTSIDELLNKAKSMKDEAELNVNKAYKDLDDFFETGGDPFKKKDDKFLGGSMAEEGQVRTGIREFLKKEYKNGRINLDKKDIERVMKYSGLSEDDPILVFKKLYGDEAYKKAGTFPGAFDVGENYNQYEEIFRKNMGTDSLKVKDSKYAGDGKLVLTESEEVRTPIKDEDVSFATGGRASFAGGKVIDEIVLMITKKEPIDAMKEVNKVLGKKGKYKNLTQEDIDRIVNQTEDYIFQRDPDNLFVEDRPMFKQKNKSIIPEDEYKEYKNDFDKEILGKTDDVDLSQGMIDLDELNFTSNAKAAKEAIDNTSINKKNKKGINLTLGRTPKDNTSVNKEIKEGVAEILSDTSPAALKASIEIDNLMLKYPGMDKLLARQIATDTNPKRKADVIAMVEQTFELDKQGKSGSEIIDIFKKTPRTEQADGGITQLRNGYYGGGQAMVGEDLSQIGHGSDSLMARNMQLAPNSMATTSTGLNYLLGEDNDTVRVPYKDGFSVQPFVSASKSNQGFEDGTNVDLQDLTYGGNVMYDKGPFSVGIEHLKGKDKYDFKYKDNTIVKDTSDRENTNLLFAIDIANTIKGKARLNKEGGQFEISMPFAEGGRTGYNEGNMVLPKPKPAQSPLVELSRIYKTYEDAMPGVSKDTQQFLRNDFIQKLNDAKISQEAFMTYRMQNSYPEGRADGGRIGFKGGGGQIGGTSDMSGGSKSKSQSTNREKGIMSRGQGPRGTTKSTTTFDSGNTGSDDRSSPKQNQNHDRAMREYQRKKPSTLENIYNTGSEVNYLKNLYKMDPIGLGISYGIKRYGPGAMEKLKGLFSEAELEEDQNGIMKMTELTEPQLGYLNSKKTQRDLKEGFLSPQQIYDKLPEYEEKTPLNPFKGDQEPTTPKEFNEYLDTIDTNKFLERITVADGGIAGLRKGYAGGKGVDIARRGFLKILGGSVAAATAFKMGLVKMLGKESGAVSKKAVDQFFASGTSGAPTWFEPLVNKALREGLDITEKAAVKDGQIVKQLDTPTGKVDVTYDTRTGAVDVDYMGGDTAMGEGLQMRYAPGDIIEEGARKGEKSDDVFEAVESIPEFQGGNYVDGPDLGFGENMTSNINDLYSDTSELATLGGEKLLVKDISNTLKKKKVLKEMDNNPQEFAQDMSPDVYYDD